MTEFNGTGAWILQQVDAGESWYGVADLDYMIDMRDPVPGHEVLSAFREAIDAFKTLDRPGSVALRLRLWGSKKLLTRPPSLTRALERRWDQLLVPVLQVWPSPTRGCSSQVEFYQRPVASDLLNGMDVTAIYLLSRRQHQIEADHEYDREFVIDWHSG